MKRRSNARPQCRRYATFTTPPSQHAVHPWSSQLPPSDDEGQTPPAPSVTTVEGVGRQLGGGPSNRVPEARNVRLGGTSSAQAKGKLVVTHSLLAGALRKAVDEEGYLGEVARRVVARLPEHKLVDW